MNTKRCIEKIFPDAVDGVDFEVVDNSDGKGIVIVEWNLPDPQPTEAELNTAWVTVEDDIAREGIKRQLADTDKDLPRALEDLIDLQISKGQFLMTDLPQSVQNKLANKKDLRRQIN